MTDITENIAALTLPLVPGSEQVIIPSGTFDVPNGALSGSGPWVLNDSNGIALADKLNSSGIDVVVDYEHQTINKFDNGKPAPAAGWLLRGGFVWRTGVGLVATAIRWTTEAAEMIREGEYRYLSPVFRYTNEGVPTFLSSVALTNTPALTSLQELAIASMTRKNKEPLMAEESIDKIEKTVEQEVFVTAPAVVAVAKPTPLAVASQSSNSLQHPMIAALTNQVAGLGAENMRLREEMAALQQQLSVSARDGIITAALSDGRLLPAMKKWAEAVSIEDLSDYLANAVPIAALSSTQTQGKKPKETQAVEEGGLSEADLAVCSQMQIDVELFKKQRVKEFSK